MASTSEWTPGDVEQAKEAREKLDIWPLDEYNCKLLNEVHPRNYVSNANKKEGSFVYDLIAIGSGAGGLVSSKQSARRGAKSAMITERLAGGDCLNVGCVPSKALIRSARAVAQVRRAAEFGVIVSGEVTVDFEAVMARLRRLRATIAPADGHPGTEQAGTHVYQGRGRLTGPNTVEVNGKTLKFEKCVLAMGGRPSIPSSIDGLQDAPFTTNENLFNLQVLPPRMIILGSGVVALEMAQSFALLGSKVTIVNRSSRLFESKLGDDEAANLIQNQLEKDGVTFLSSSTAQKVETINPGDGNKKLPLMKVTVGDKVLECECLLVAAGRAANVENCGLEEANVDYELGKGVKVNDYAQSVSNPSVYAVGDCCAGVPRLTHMSGEMAKLVVQNSLANDEWKLSSLVVPAVAYTEPEYATVGIASEEQAKKQGVACDVYKTSLEHNDRAILESSNIGFVKILVKKDTDDILGATIVAERAGEMINEVSLAMKNNLGLYAIGRNIHPYPTTGEAVMGCGVQYINKHLPRLD
ncbi:dihydrolipoyl dehydrogenase [Nitzschia inconspicua]|uniref:Dihydrolipoyl dehydrogenase n=1 Tax=Nitzschia inconspicua TaxID=303405 RepID=A0A9K3LX52_9STRA|nr:dihydrolipoyl dehydrogenase [Nitzschia inconspicua]